MTPAQLAFMMASNRPESGGGGPTTIFEHNFGGSPSTELNGITSDVGGKTWVANTNTKADGSFTGSSANLLDFTISSGKIFTLTATMDVVGTWGAVGFSEGNNTNATWLVANDVWAWIFNRGDDTSATAFITYLGQNTTGSSSYNPDPNLVGDVDFEIIINTNPATWTCEFKLNGSSIRGPTAFGSNPTSITYAGFGGQTLSAGTNISHIRLTEE
jgi:hypothetical protein